MMKHVRVCREAYGQVHDFPNPHIRVYVYFTGTHNGIWAGPSFPLHLVVPNWDNVVTPKCARWTSFPHGYIDGLVQDCSNSSALAMELLQSCIRPSIYSFTGGQCKHCSGWLMRFIFARYILSGRTAGFIDGIIFRGVLKYNTIPLSKLKNLGVRWSNKDRLQISAPL